MIDKEKWAKPPSKQTLENAITNMKNRGITVMLVDNKAQALSKIKELIPEGAEVMTGSSTTLYEIGFMEMYISGKHKWIALGPQIFNEKDPKKQLELRYKAIIANYMIASVNAIAETGELVACDRSGSRVTTFPMAARKLILVVGYQKITKNLQEAMQRVRDYVFFLEDERAKKAYGMGSKLSKWVIIENEDVKDRITVILVQEQLGF